MNLLDDGIGRYLRISDSGEPKFEAERATQAVSDACGRSMVCSTSHRFATGQVAAEIYRKFLMSPLDTATASVAYFLPSFVRPKALRVSGRAKTLQPFDHDNSTPGRVCTAT